MSFRKPIRSVPVRLGAHYKEQARWRRSRTARRMLLLAVAAGVGVGTFWGATASGVSHDLLRTSASEAAPGAFTCTVASITDGDTFRCRETETDGKQIRVRLSGVAAREKDGSCTPGHPCPDAPPEASTAALRALASGQALNCRQVGSTYGRRAAFCSLANGTDLSCAVVEGRTAAKWAKHWGDHDC